MSEVELLRELLKQSYRAVEAKDGQEMQYCGLYLLKWNRREEVEVPDLGFVQWDDEEIDKALASGPVSEQVLWQTPVQLAYLPESGILEAKTIVSIPQEKWSHEVLNFDLVFPGHLGGPVDLHGTLTLTADKEEDPCPKSEEPQKS